MKDFAGVSFWIAGAYLPREGELFCLEAGTVCKVKAVRFNVGRIKEESSVLAMSNVYAVQVKKRRNMTQPNVSRFNASTVGVPCMHS